MKIVDLLHQGDRRNPLNKETVQKIFTGLSHCRIPIRHIKRESLLGGGSFGNVVRASWKGRAVALKVMRPTKHDEWTRKSTFARELIAMGYFLPDSKGNVKHPNIVEFLGWNMKRTEDPATGFEMTLVMPLAPGGSLRAKLRENPVFERKEVMRCALHVLEALTFLHSQIPKMLHRDIKPENVLLFGDAKNNTLYKLCDFGEMAVQYHTTYGSSHIGTLPYMAPEMKNGIEKQKHNESIDIYSFGVVLWELISGTGPNEWNWRSTEQKDVKNNKYPPWTKVHEKRRLDEKLQYLKECAMVCCRFDPKERKSKERDKVIIKLRKWILARKFEQRKGKCQSGSHGGSVCTHRSKENACFEHHQTQSESFVLSSLLDSDENCEQKEREQKVQRKKKMEPQEEEKLIMKPSRPTTMSTSLEKICKGKFARGPKKGKACTYKAKENGYCGFHKAQCSKKKVF